MPDSPLGEGFKFLLSLLFALWPVYLFAPLGESRRSRRSQAVPASRMLKVILVIWAALAVVRIALIFISWPIIGILVPEPWNTLLFFACGAVLLAVKLSIDARERRDIQTKANNAAGVGDLLSLSPTDFENMIVELYTAMGHKARRTGATGDHGVDVVVQASNGEKWVVQAKRWRGSVGEPIVRDFHGVMQHEKADKGAIITTGRFTAQARDWAQGKPITLLEGDEFLQYLKRARGTAKPSTTQTTIPQVPATNAVAAPVCPRCGSAMVLRTARQGPNTGEQFWGCSTYPKCRGIVKVSEAP